MIKGSERLTTTNSARAIQFALKLSGFGIDRKIGVSGLHVGIDELSNVLKLGITVRRQASSFVFANFSQPKVLFIHPLSNRVISSGCPHRIEFFLKPSGSQIGKDDFWVIGIATGSCFGQ